MSLPLEMDLEGVAPGDLGPGAACSAFREKEDPSKPVVGHPVCEVLGRFAGFDGLTLDRDGRAVSGTPRSVAKRASDRLLFDISDPRFGAARARVSGKTMLGLAVVRKGCTFGGLGRDGENKRFGKDCDGSEGANYTDQLVPHYLLRRQLTLCVSVESSLTDVAACTGRTPGLGGALPSPGSPTSG